MVKRLGFSITILLLAVIQAQNMADFFLRKELYFEAVTEYKRLLFLGNCKDEDELLFKMAEAYYLANQIEAAEVQYQQVIENDESSQYDLKSLICLAKIYWDSYDYENFRSVLDCIANQSEPATMAKMLYIKAWSFIYQANWEEGIEYLQQVQFVNTTSLVQDIRAVSNVPQKSKRLALYMSYILPGSGQIYVADYRNAALSFILVGSIGASMIWDVYQKAYFIALVKYFFLYTRYASGGLRNLAKKVDTININRIGDYLKEVSQKYPNPILLLESFDPIPESVPEHN